MDVPRLADVAGALASPTRARMVGALLSGTAHTSRELANHVSVAPSTASEHLRHLLDVGLVTVEAQGRHRYFRLAGPHVAQLVETMAVVAADLPPPPPTPRVPAGLGFARSCYDHLAGALGVAVCDRLRDLEALAFTDGTATITPSGRRLLSDMGVEVNGNGSRPAVRLCLDWSQRRHHLAGALGAALLRHMLQQRWLYRSARRPRELRLSDRGRSQLRAHLELQLP